MCRQVQQPQQQQQRLTFEFDPMRELANTEPGCGGGRDETSHVSSDESLQPEHSGTPVSAAVTQPAAVKQFG